MFSCCASCGEIKDPLGTRLCTSLQPQFDIDAVILGHREAHAAFARELKTRLPWLRKLFFILPSGGPAAGELPPWAFALSETDFLPTEAGKSSTSPEAWLHLLAQSAGLSEYYIVIPSGSVPDDAPRPLDYFTPNGIALIPSFMLAEGLESILAGDDPLNALKNRHKHLNLPAISGSLLLPYPQTVENSKDFCDFFNNALINEEYGDGAAYRAMLQQWLFLSGKGIPVPRTAA